MAAGVWWNHLRNDMAVSIVHAGAPEDIGLHCVYLSSRYGGILVLSLLCGLKTFFF